MKNNNKIQGFDYIKIIAASLLVFIIISKCSNVNLQELIFMVDI